MAGSRAAASVSLTIGVAFVTLLVAGGILAGPAILDCSHQSGGIGACLRAKVQDAGLLPNDPSSSSSVPAVSLQTTPAETRPQGWLEANANEYETPTTTGSVELAAPAGSIGVEGTLASKPALAGDVAVAAPTGVIAANGQPIPAPDTTADVALAQPAGRLAATGRSPAASGDRTQVALAQPAGRLAATGQPPIASSEGAQVALAVPVGRLDASGKLVARPDGAAVDLSPGPNGIDARGTALPGSIDTSGAVTVAAPTGVITSSGLGTPGVGAGALADPRLVRGGAVITGNMTSAATRHGGVALEAEAEIPQATPTPVFTPPAVPVSPSPKVTPKPRPPKAAVATPPKAGPRRVFKANPRYPNVIGLPPPPPIAAANSSFATLELR